MIWSYSSAIQFLSCERKWYYAHKYASYRSANTERRHVAYLKDLSSLDEWKGNLVDTVISKFVHREKKYDKNPSLDDYIEEARSLIRNQFHFANEKQWEKMKRKTDHLEKGEFLILAPLFFDTEIPKHEKERIWQQIKFALENYFEDSELVDEILDAKYVFTQYPLRIKRQNITLEGKPDLLLFFENKPPLIIDWKVYQSSAFTHEQQLFVYAYLISESNPIPDKFPKNLKNFQLQDYKLCEYQLLTGEKRFYTMQERDIYDTEEFINETIYKMKKKGCHSSPTKLNADNFRTTFAPDTCMKCNFKSICWL